MILDLALLLKMLVLVAHLETATSIIAFDASLVFFYIYFCYYYYFTSSEKGGLMDIDQEDLMFLVPPLFTSKDMPENLV